MYAVYDDNILVNIAIVPIRTFCRYSVDDMFGGRFAILQESDYFPELASEFFFVL
jgi:hypothetical protein